MTRRAQLLAVRQQIEVVRLQCDVLAGVVDALLQDEWHEAPPVPPPTACAHPEDDRRDASTLTHPRRFWCRRCSSFDDAPLEEEPLTSGLRR